MVDREGVLPLSPDTTADQGIHDLLSGSGIELTDVEHGIRCGRFAAALFDGLHGYLGLSFDDRPLAIAVGLFHDAGYARSGRDHHRKSYDVIRENLVPSLSLEDRIIVACAARYHGSTVPNIEHAGFADLNFSDQRRVRRLAAVVQVAAALDASHFGVIESVDVNLNEDVPVVVAHASKEPSIERGRLREAAGRFQHLSQLPLRTRIVVHSSHGRHE